MSPTTAWIGATISTIHIAIDSMVRTASLPLPRSRCQAAEAPTNSAVDRKAAIDMCTRRYGNEGLKMIFNQSTGTMRPPTMA
jgi:hypothetical protein